jgi:quercetin dioxygenase-like cupin family protein
VTVWRVVCAGLIGAAACGHPRDLAPAPQRDTAAGLINALPAPVDAAEASEDERLAAIQKAMNELRGAAQECWAAAATERFDIDGELTFQIEIAAPADRRAAGKAHATAVHDTARNAKLATCVTQLLAAYPWAPPLYGQTIQLPFKFRAPDGQNTIDRALVAWNGQGSGTGRVAVAVLLDENNTGNDAASMFELAVAAGGSTGLRRASRAELWYFAGPGQVGFAGATHAVAAGDMMYAPKGAAREIAATTEDLHAVLVMVPGGREGAARGGALPTPEATGGAAGGGPVPVILPAARAKTSGATTIFAEPATIRDKTLAASLVALPASTKVVEHMHANETELWYMLAGAGTLTVNGVDLPVAPTSVVQIPKNTRHAFAVTTDCRALQIFTPAGPEQGFKARP